MKKYLSAILLLILNLVNYQYGINKIIFFSAGLILIIMMYYFCKQEKVSTLTALIEIMCYTWPISWINIFGSSTKELQLPWFYILGLLIVIYVLFGEKSIYRVNKTIDVMIFTVLLYSIVPLINAQYFADGLAEFIMILFFVLLTFSAYQKKEKIPDEEYNAIIKSFIFINLISAFVIIFQYIMYKYTGAIYFKMNIAGSFSKNAMQVGSELLFEDASSATIMLGCGVLFALIEASKRKYNYIIAIVILIGLALTSRRTGVVSLLLILVPFFLFHYRGGLKKMASMVLLLIASVTLIYFIDISRPFDQVSQLADDNGRFRDYISSVELIIKEPLGVGYGDKYLASLMTGHIIAHNTMLRWLNFGGVLLAVPLLSLIIYSIYVSYKKKLIHVFWALLYTGIAMNFIPDILNARFITILCIVALIYKGEIKNEQKNIHNSTSLQR